MSARPSADALRSARNEGGSCGGCGHLPDQHYLNAPRSCAVGGCACAAYGAVVATAKSAPKAAELRRQRLAEKQTADQADATRDQRENGVSLLLPIDRIDSSPLNPRKRFNADELQELAASLEADGLLQPIVVTPAGERYVIVAGERRWRAAKLIGWTEIAAIVRHDVDDATHIRLALLENLARTDLDPLEEAEGYRQLSELGMTQDAIAAAVHRSRPAVANAIRLLRAPHEILDRLESGELTVSHVLALRKYEAFPALMRKLADMAVEEDLTSKELEGGIPEAYQLERDGLLRRLGHAAFDKKVCESCPFDARRTSDNGYTDYCLKPEHYDQLEAEAQTKLAAATKKQLEKATATGKQVPKLDKLPYGSFERIGSTVPAGCSEACACRGAGIGYGGGVEQICTDPKRYNRLRTATQREESKAKKKLLNELLDRLNDKLDLIEQIGERELAILATAALAGLSAPDLREAVKFSGGLIEVKDLEDYRERDRLPRKLATLAPRDLVRMAVYAVLHHELRNALQGYGNGQKPRADWYLADQPARPTGKPLVEAFHPDDHLADDIAAEAERLEGAFELAGATA